MTTILTERLHNAGVRGGSAKKHRWTEDDKDFVREHYKGTRTSAKWIAKQLEVTEFGVKGQVQNMGLAMQKSPPWTRDEIQQLTEMIHVYSIRTIAEKLHRSQNAVKIKATRLKMKLRIRYGWYTKKDCCEILGVDHHKIDEWFKAGKLKATWHSGVKPQKNGMAMWHIDIVELRRFIIRNAEILQGRNVDIQQVVAIVAGGADKQPTRRDRPSGKCPRCGADLMLVTTLEGIEQYCMPCGFRPGQPSDVGILKEGHHANGQS